MSLTTSYFAVARYLGGTKISIARFHHPIIRNSLDEVIDSFAPSSDLLKDYKKGEVTWPQYRGRYLSEQRRHYKEAPEDFAMLLDRAMDEELVLLCYERFEGRGTKCHRVLLFDILKSIADAEEYDIDFIDETPYRKRNL